MYRSQSLHVHWKLFEQILYQEMWIILLFLYLMISVTRKAVYRYSAIKAKKKALICPDKFKYSLRSEEVSKICQDLLPKDYESSSIILADGGQGSLDSISQKIKGEWTRCKVMDPLFRSIQAQYYVAQNKQSYIEMARASGLQLLQKNEKNPLYTTTYGTGELIIDSIQRGNTTINLLIGGSATNQAGIGVANALGYEFQDENGQLLKPIGQSLAKIRKIRHQDQRLKKLIENSTINVYTDVKNPFTGEKGATRVYGPQKGATPQIVQELQGGMQNLRRIFQLEYRIDVNKIAGSGAAGGLGGGCSAFLNSQLYGGIDLMFSLTNFQELVKECDVIITGQGRVDHQTLQGKVVKGVIDRATKYNKRVVVICAFCENPEDFQSMKNVELIQLLNDEERQVIDPSLTRSRLEKFVRQYSW